MHGCQRHSPESSLTRREAMTRSSFSRSFLGILLSCGMIALAACSDSTSSSATITVGRTLSLYFQAGNGAPPPPQISAVGGIGTVRVTGGYEAAACGPPRGTAHRDGNAVRLDVEAAVPNPPCDAARVVYKYDATLLGLEPAEYTLEVYHRLDPADERLLVHRVRVTVQ
jgi:hypothetical protein